MNTLKLIIVVFLLCSSIFPQTYTYEEYPTVIQEIERYYDGSYKYNRDSQLFDNNAWAGKNGAILTRNTFRLIYTWVLNIPQDANITSAILYIGGTTHSNAQHPIVNIQWQIKKFPNDKFNAQPSEQWNAITSSDVLRNEVHALNTQFEGSPTLDQTFLTYIQNGLSTQRLHISIRGTDEETWGNNRNVHYIDYKYSGHQVWSALKIKINYTIPTPQIDLTAQNNFIYGKINVGVNVPATERDSPFLIQNALIGQSVNLGAKNQPYGGYERVWNNYAPNNQSKWTKNGADVWPNIDYSFQVTQSDDDATYQANLRKNFKIDQTHKTEFNGNQSQQNTEWIVEQNSGNISTQSSRLIDGKNYLFAGWEDNLTLGTSRNITPTDNKVYDVLYKYPHHSNTTTAYQNPGQRRFIRSNSGHLHMVYESMNKVWYERSTNNGQTWQIMNGGKPIYEGIATHPSIDFYPNNDNVIIVYNKDEYAIAAQYYENGFFQCESIVADNSIWGQVTPDSKPVIAWTYSRLMVAWNASGEIFYTLGQKVTISNPPYHDFYWYFDPRPISTFIESYKDNPTIGTSKQQLLGFWLAWDRDQSFIEFAKLDAINGATDIQQSPVYTYGQAGFSQNYQPSISVTPNNDYRISWFGKNEIDGAVTKKVVTYFNYQFYIFGNSPVSSHSMSVTDDGKAIIAYGDQDGTRNKFRQVWYWFSDKNLGTTGRQTHLSNGSSANNMYAMSFQNATLPYSFTMSASLGSLQKVTEIPIACGRKGIVAGDSAEFYFTLGDVTLNGNTIDFIQTGINPDFTKLDTLNYYLSTQKFNVTNSSQFNFSIEYGVTDSLKAVQSLGENEFVKFKLQLINANHNNVIGEYTFVTFTKQNVIPYYGKSFSINTNGIGNKKVRVRIVVEENIGGSYAMANISAEENVLPKQNQNVISYSGSEVVTEYALEQNYPNPFNPTTTIKYQIPTSGNVTIKVYDILGNEVANLIDGYMETGKYEVDFDAYSLASGVYIYRLNVNDYVNVKKMVLLK